MMSGVTPGQKPARAGFRWTAANSLVSAADVGRGRMGGGPGKRRDGLFDEVMANVKKQGTRLQKRAKEAAAANEKEERVVTEVYVDQFRAAGVSYGSSDIKKQMTLKGQQERASGQGKVSGGCGGAAAAAVAMHMDMYQEDTTKSLVWLRFGNKQMQQREPERALISFDMAAALDKDQASAATN